MSARVQHPAWRWAVIGGLLATMGGLMLGPLREESATIDEPIYLATGYLRWQGLGHRLNPEHPPLGKLLAGAPLLACDLHVPEFLRDLAELRLGSQAARPWNSWQRGRATDLYPQGREDWYYWPYWEAESAGQEFVYGGWTDADKLLWAGRGAQVVVTLLLGLVIAGWACQRAGWLGGILACAGWVFNPLALGYGHLVQMDVGVALLMTLAIWAFGDFLERPGATRALLTGLAVGGALVMKFSALLLAPIFGALIALFLWTRRSTWPGANTFWRWLPVIGLAAWAVVLLVYLPGWRPAPVLSAAAAQTIGVPEWFRSLRSVLLPPEFFKGIALQVAHSLAGHEAFLHGEWRAKGWWYYFPVALALKLPVPFLLASGAGWCGWLRRVRQWSFAEAAPWVAALTYLAIAMTSTINLGVRYLMPMIPLLIIGIVDQWARRGRGIRVAGWVLCGWLATVAVWAHPFYLEYCNEFAGGTAKGYRWLVDSNYDWGQDTKRLRDWLQKHDHPRLQLLILNHPKTVEYYGIAYERATPVSVREAQSGTLVISASCLMETEWRWLDRHPPADRIGKTLFVYRLPVRQ